MKVVIINGSPRHPSNTLCISNIIKDRMNQSDIEVEIINLNEMNLTYCHACDNCFKTQDERCIFDDGLNEIIQKLKDADSIIIGSPIHCGEISALTKMAMDRITYVSLANKGLFKNKLGSTFVTVRRMGALSGLNTLNNYLTYAQINLITADSWNIVHGAKVDEVVYDKEGMSAIKRMCDSMISKLTHNDKETTIKKEYLNYIRDDLK